MKKKVELKKTVKNNLTKELTDEELLEIKGGKSYLEKMEQYLREYVRLPK